MTGLTHEQIIDIVGRLDDDRVAEIIDTGATEAELMEAYSWMTSDGVTSGAGDRHSLSGRVALVFEILTADEALEEEQEA